MKKLTGFLFLAIVSCFTISAQDISYDALSIPENLKKNANVVKRYENIVYEVSDLEHAATNIHQVYTVMNPKGNHILFFREDISKITQLDDAEIKVYNMLGKQVARYKQKDMTTVASGDGLIEDGKTVYFQVPVSDYPVTVEYKYQVRHKETLFYPPYLYIGFDEGVQYSSFTAKVPKDLEVRYKEKNTNIKPEPGSDSKYKWYTWRVKDLEPISYEEGNIPALPHVRLAPNRFRLHDYEGDCSTWASFGRWYNELYKGRDVLPPKTVAFFQDLVKDIPDPKEKARKLYEYLQKNFRYVSIQLGIGGLQPFSAEFTDQKKYGDCKSLSNYMKAALKCVGIKSYIVIINAGAGRSGPDADFPSKHSNHVILCIPLAKDSVWLECTSNTNDFGVLGSFTENRTAMLLSDEGGVLVTTPSSKAIDNYFGAKTVVTLKEDGSGTTVTAFRVSGEYKETMNRYLDEKEDDKKEFVVSHLGFKQPDEFILRKDESNAGYGTRLEMDFEKVPEFVAGNKMFIASKLYKLSGVKLPKSDGRKTDFYFTYPFVKVDTTVFKLPEGYTVEALPNVKSMKGDYADYATQYWYNESERAIYSTTQLALKHYKIPPASYADIKKLFDEILLDDAQRIVIKKL
jgi:transglutaminase-like putative cysteine protease